MTDDVVIRGGRPGDAGFHPIGPRYTRAWWGALMQVMEMDVE
jgi:hypothetical protein